jgi:hypothetical protein
MNRGVTDFNMSFLGNLRFHPWIFHHAFRQIGVCTTHGASASTYVSSLCAALPFQISNQDLFAPGPVALHGFCATDPSRKPARHRNLSARSSDQALSTWHPWRSTLADANEQRDWRIFADFGMRLIQIARALYADDDFALDTPTIDLCLSVFRGHASVPPKRR